MYTWILSTGWWVSRAPIDPDAVLVVAVLCTSLIGGFIYINRYSFGVMEANYYIVLRVIPMRLVSDTYLLLFCRVKPSKSLKIQYRQSLKLIIVIAFLYGLWCASQIYLVNPRRPAVGEEADLGVLVFLFMYFFLPHYLCIASMNPKDYATEQLPL